VATPRFGRFGDAALWILVVLAAGPRSAGQLLADVRRRDGPVGPGTLFGAIARLERAALIEPMRMGVGPPLYRLATVAAEGP
jgi:DNA-binding PadR family transcriptional regulator